MTPKEKAEELVIEMKIDYTVPYIIAKQCALIAIDEILNNVNGALEYESDIEYWQEVKQEIEKL